MGDSIAKRAVTEWFLYFVLTEEIPSDEDEVNENQQQQQLASPPGRSGAEDDDEDDYWDDDGFEGTPLEEYSTPLDFDNGEDEYLFFTSTLLRMFLHLSTGFNMYTHTHPLTDGFFSHARTPELWCSLVPLADGSTEWRPKKTAAGDLQHLTTEKSQRQGPVRRLSGQ